MAGPESDPSDGVGQLRLQFTDDIDEAESIVESDGGLVERMRDEFGDELRVVGVYGDHTFEFLYVKPAVRQQYTEQEFAATGDEFILSGRQEDAYHERLFHLGSFEYEVQGFEQGQVMRIPLDVRKGLILSFDSTVDVAVPGFVERLKREHEITFR